MVAVAGSENLVLQMNLTDEKPKEPSTVKRECEVNGERRSAIFSDCERYRYTLEIIWGTLATQPKLMQVIGLNPSTATHEKDDPTLRRCKAFAKREGCDGLVMTNLFAWRDTDPAKMKKAQNPIGEVKTNSVGEFNENNYQLLFVASSASIVVAAWGNHGAFLGRGRFVANMISDLRCFRVTGAGHPEHPLYMPEDQPLTPFRYA